jgi:hypothetical protein
VALWCAAWRSGFAQTPFSRRSTPRPAGSRRRRGRRFDCDGDFDLVGPGGIAVNDGHGRFTLAAATGLVRARKDGCRRSEWRPDRLRNTGIRWDHPIDLNLGGFAFTHSSRLPAIPAPYGAHNRLGDVDGDGDTTS